MLWVGWYGFNAGSAVAADGIAANAFMTTTLAAAVAAVVWPALEWIIARQADGARLLLGRGRRPRRHHAGLPASSRRRARSSSACSRASSRSSPAPSSRRSSATTTRSTPSACTASAARWARSHRLLRHARGRTPNLNTNLAGMVGKTLWLEQLKAMGLTRRRCRSAATAVIALRAQGGHRPAPDAEAEEDGPRRHRSRRGGLPPRRGRLPRQARRTPCASVGRRSRDSGVRRPTMKKIEAIIKPFKLDEVKERLRADRRLGHDGLRGQGVRPHGRQDGGLSRLGLRRGLRAQGADRGRGQGLDGRGGRRRPSSRRRRRGRSATARSS